jgi:flagellar basal body rod protein FlgB
MDTERTCTQYHAEGPYEIYDRDGSRCLATNIANIDTPGYKARDLEEARFWGNPSPRKTSWSSWKCAPLRPKHLNGTLGPHAFRYGRKTATRSKHAPTQNNVVLEDQMSQSLGYWCAQYQFLEQHAAKNTPSSTAKLRCGNQVGRLWICMNTIHISSSGLKAQQDRLKMVSQNIANAESVGTRDGQAALPPPDDQHSRTIRSTARPGHPNW